MGEKEKDNLRFPGIAPSGTAERILHWGGGGERGDGVANKEAPESLTSKGFWGNSSPKNFEILKLGNATFSILGEISKK